MLKYTQVGGKSTKAIKKSSDSEGNRNTVTVTVFDHAIPQYPRLYRADLITSR
jgi:hypothetical protein